MHAAFHGHPLTEGRLNSRKQLGIAHRASGEVGRAPRPHHPTQQRPAQPASLSHASHSSPDVTDKRVDRSQPSPGAPPYPAASAAWRRSRCSPLPLASACPALLTPPLHRPAVQNNLLAMETILELLDILPWHFGSVATNGAAATDAECMAVRLSELAHAERAGLSSAHAVRSAGLDR